MRQLLSNHPLKDSLFSIVTIPIETAVPEPECQQPKPQHSYIGLIAMAILSSPHKKMVLAEVYEWIMTEYPYFRSRGAGWRNSIRHNLSLNDCFVKAGRAANGKVREVVRTALLIPLSGPLLGRASSLCSGFRARRLPSPSCSTQSPSPHGTASRGGRLFG